jgi:hypothetical protein
MSSAPIRSARVGEEKEGSRKGGVGRANALLGSVIRFFTFYFNRSRGKSCHFPFFSHNFVDIIRRYIILTIERVAEYVKENNR